MASTTAEVMLYFQCDNPEFRKAIDTLRFITTPQMTTREIIDLLRPVWDGGFSDGYAQAEYDRED